MVARIKKRGCLKRAASFVLGYDNDSNNWVYFDDLKVTHTRSNILQYNEYYPFGLQTNSSWTREGNSNNYLYNEGSELNGNSGWYETFFRGYDPTLGRFHQVDPLAHASSSHTPYNYAYNDPVFYNDPNGDYPEPIYIDPQHRGGGSGFGDWVYGGASGFNNYVSGLFGGSPIPSGQHFGSSPGSFINGALNSTYGGSWTRGVSYLFTSGEEALAAGVAYNNRHNSWGYTSSNSKTYQASSVHNKYQFK